MKLDIQIGNYTYQIHIEKNFTKRSFKCLIDYDILNDDLVVKNLYFFEQDLENYYAFPIDGETKQFSTSVFDFDNDFSEYSVSDVNNGEEIPCDRIKVFHPHNKTDLKYILCIYSLINNINIYFLCKDSDFLDLGGDTEFRKNNNTYSEFKSCIIPNFDSILSKDFFIKSLGNLLIINLLFKKFFYILNSEKLYEKHYIEDFNEQLLTRPIQVLMFPYSGISESNNSYLLSDDLNPNTEVFRYDYSLTLASKITFNQEHTIGLIGEFKCGNIDRIDEIVSLYNSTNKVKSICENKARNSECTSVADFRNMCPLAYLTALHNEWLGEYTWLDNSEAVNEEFESEEYPISITVGIFSDIQLSNLVWLNEYNSSNIDNFFIPIEGIFSSWNQKPQTVVLRIQFKDRLTNVTINSNIMTLDNDKFKYIIKENTNNPVLDMTILQRESNPILIDKFNCTVSKKVYNEIKVNGGAVSNVVPKIILKPIFYRTFQLQNVNIKQGFTQNIGINLADYMTKVESFSLVINGATIVESARNDAFVIFKILPNNIPTVSGQYHIINLDGDYISSGNFTID